MAVDKDPRVETSCTIWMYVSCVTCSKLFQYHDLSLPFICACSQMCIGGVLSVPFDLWRGGDGGGGFLVQ